MAEGPLFLMVIILTVTLNGLCVAKRREKCSLSSRKNKACCDWSNCSPEPDFSCNYTISLKSQEKFVKKLDKKSEFVFLELDFGADVSENATKCVIQPTHWVWTPSCATGSLYQKLPLGFDIWSSTALNVSVFGPVTLNITQQGTCDLLIGDPNSTNQLARAFIPLGQRIADMFGDQFESHGSSFCYRERVYIESDFLYQLCLHVVCPLQALGYRCCHYDTEKPDMIQCDASTTAFEFWWWISPFILGIILCAFFPPFLMSTADKIHSYLDSFQRLEKRQYNEEEPLLNMAKNNSEDRDTEFYPSHKPVAKVVLETNTRPVTIASICVYQVFRCFSFRTVLISRIMRALFPVFSLSLVSLNVWLLYLFHNESIIHAVLKGVPLGFPSILAGVKETSYVFLRYFGGPYLACMIYITVGAIYIAVPNDLAVVLQNGLRDNKDISTSPLTLDRKTIQKYGRYDILKYWGYGRVYQQIAAGCFMLLDFSFWKYSISLQVQRWMEWLMVLRHRCSRVCSGVGMFLTFTPYLLICCIELCLTFMYYGLPLVNFTHTFVRAYFKITTEGLKRFKLCRIIRVSVAVFVSLFALFIMYMFAIIFMDSFLFLTRMAIYTFTGVFAHPSNCYGYAVFFLWVGYYICESFNKVGIVYHQLLKDTILMSRSLQLTGTGKFIEDVDGVVGIREDLFEYVIEKKKPKMKELFVTAVKVVFIIIVILFSIQIIEKFKGKEKIFLLTHIFQTIFICMAPKLVTLCLGKVNRRVEDKYAKEELKEIILEFWQNRENENLTKTLCKK